MPKYAINGRFVVRKQTGQERFASELVSELDKIVDKDEFIVVVPEYAEKVPCYKNIQVVRYGKIKSHFWEQISFYRYLKKYRLISINLTTTCPFFSPDIVCIHDAAYFEISKILTHNLYGKLSTIWHRLLARAAAKRAKKILTVSFYSEDKLSNILGVAKERFAVIRNAWQHLNRVEPDDSIFESLPQVIEKKCYFMALSSLSPQKNFIWITEVAKRNPDKQFVVCGSVEGYTRNGGAELKADNVHFTGFVSDGQMKSLMSQCKAFIHPAIYEGFGIPPLEALSCGAQLILSSATCLPEIYGNVAHYIDPYKYDYDLDMVLKSNVDSAEKILFKYSWKTEAQKLLSIIKNSK